MEAVLWGEGAELGAKSVLTLFILNSSISCLPYLTRAGAAALGMIEFL